MDNRYNLYNLEASFKDYLLAGNRSPKSVSGRRSRADEPGESGTGVKNLQKISIKNYLSDFRHFQGWLIFKSKVESRKSKIYEPQNINLISMVTPMFIEEYKSYLNENKIPVKTINRRLSTLRKFCSFCISQGWMKENPAKRVSNVLPSRATHEQPATILDQFETDLQKEKLDKKTITSYLDDIQEFLQV